MVRKHIFRSLIIFFALIQTQAALGQAPIQGRWQLVTAQGGPISAAVPLSTGTSLLMEGDSLVEVDLRGQPAVERARQALPYGPLRQLRQAGGAYYALADQGLLRLAEPSGGGLPAVTGFAPGGGQAFDVRGDLAVVAAGEAGLRLVRIEPGGALRPLNQMDVAGSALDAALDDSGRVYVATGAGGLLTLDITDPANPQLAPGPLMPQAGSVAVPGGLLTAADGARVHVFDPARPDAPLGIYAPLAEGRRAAAQGEYLYIADAHDGLKILWLTAPDRPLQTFGEHDRPAFDVLVSGDLAYVAGADGLRIYDVSSKFRPLSLGRLPLKGTPTDITAFEDTIFIAYESGGIAIIDAANRGQPVLRVRLPIEGAVRGLAYARGLLYATTDSLGLIVISGLEGGSPQIAARLALPAPAYELARRGDALYAAGGLEGLLGIDISQPLNPVLAGVLPASSQAAEGFTALTLTGKRAYLADGLGFIVVDVSDVQNMGRLATVEAAAGHIATDEIYLYALAGERITIFDARATAEPIRLREYAALDSVTAMRPQGDQLYLSGPGADVVALSLAAPDAPFEAGNLSGPGGGGAAWPQGAGLWLARGAAGAQFVEITDSGGLIRRAAYSPGLPGANRLGLSEGGQPLLGGLEGWQGDPMAQQGAWGLAADALTAAVAAGPDGLLAYTPNQAGGWALSAQRSTPGAAFDVALDGRYIYAAETGGLAIYDRRALVPLSRVDTPAPASALAVGGEHAFLALGDGSLAVVALGTADGGIRPLGGLETRLPADIIPAPDGDVYLLAGDVFGRLLTDDPANLFLQDRSNLPSDAARGFFYGDLLAGFSPGRPIRLYDVSRLPAQGAVPRGLLTLGTAEQPGANIEAGAEGRPVLAALAQDRTGYAAYGLGGLAVLDLSQPGQGRIFYTGEVNGLYQEGDVLFAAGRSLATFDISQPGDPRLLDELALTAPAYHIAPAGEVLYLASTTAGLSVIGWDGARLSLIGEAASGPARQALALGERAFVANEQGGLLLVDFSEPAAPVPLFSYTSGYGAFVSDMQPLNPGTLLIAWEGGVEALSFNLAAEPPRLLSVTPSGGATAHDLAYDPGTKLAALALGADGIALFDAARPQNPRLLSQISTPGGGLRVALAGEALYAADGACGLHAFDISRPRQPRYMAHWPAQFAADVLALPGGQVALLDAGRLITLAYDPAGAAAVPAVPQSPRPAPGAADQPLDVLLAWGPPADACADLRYEIYFGPAENPGLLGQSDVPQLQLSGLNPGRTYYWRVAVIGPAGGRSEGPLWQFRTTEQAMPSVLPPSPLPWLARLLGNPAVTLGLIAALLAGLGAGYIYWRWRRGRADPGK